MLQFQFQFQMFQMFQMFQDFKSTPVAFQLFSLVMHCATICPQNPSISLILHAAGWWSLWTRRCSWREGHLAKIPGANNFWPSTFRAASRKSRRLMKLGVVKTWWMRLEYAVSAHGHAQHSTPQESPFPLTFTFKLPVAPGKDCCALLHVSSHPRCDPWFFIAYPQSCWRQNSSKRKRQKRKRRKKKRHHLKRLVPKLHEN